MTRVAVCRREGSVVVVGIVRAVGWLAVVAGTAACSTDGPRVTETSPRTLFVTDLPNQLKVRGEGLGIGVELDLDEERKASPRPIEARLGSVSVAVLDHRSQSELTIDLPESLTPATYDLTLFLPHNGTVSYPGAITVLPAAESTTGTPSSLPSDGTSTPSSTATSSSSAESTDIEMDAQACGTWQFEAPQVVSFDGLTAVEFWAPVVSADGLTMYFGATALSQQALWVASRSERASVEFTGATKLAQMVISTNAGTPMLTRDGLGLYFFADPWNGRGDRDLYKATRASLDAAFGDAVALTELSSNGRDHLPWISEDELTMVFLSDRGGNQDLWMATRTDVTVPFNAPTAMDSLNLGSTEGRLAMVDDGLTAFFTSDRTSQWVGQVINGRGGEDIWIATRSDTDAEFGEIENVAELNTGSTEQDLSLSADGAEVFFVSNRTGNSLIYRAVRTCAEL